MVMFNFFRWLFSFGKTSSEFSKEIFSFDNRICLKLMLDNGKFYYEIFKDKKPLVKRSSLGIALGQNDFLGKGLLLIRTNEKTVDDTWEPLWGEERQIRNQYKEIALYFAEKAATKRLITVRFRVFDQGVAFRYEIPAQPDLQKMVVMDEQTIFNVDANSYAWTIPAYQSDRYEYNYDRKSIYEIKDSVHTPLTIETPNGYFLSIHEAALYNYGSMTLKTTSSGALLSDITPLSDGARAYVDLPFETPWRVIMIADSAIDLTLNRMIYNLNDPPRHDFSWVRPLKFMGIWWAMYIGEYTWAEGQRHGATTAHAKEYIDDCAALGIPGLLVEGWNNGWSGDWLANGPTNDFLHPTSDFDLPEVAKYAKEKGIELVGHHETVGYVDNYERQLDAAYKYYADNGIKYVKPGYAGARMTIQGRKEFHHSQLGVRHYQKALELAAKYHICLDVHEPIKGTGIERTWPNLLSHEGARGQEYEGGALFPSHATILPFTRLLSGGMDYTSGIFDVSNNVKRMATTLARQLAYYVTIFSGMQMAADRPRFYKDIHPDAFKFIKDVPVSWDKTLPLFGSIGQFYVVARKDRNSGDWYVGGVTNEEGRRIRISLDFLDDGCRYLAEIYRDGDDAHYRENQLSIIIDSREVTKLDNLDLYMAPGGGFAVRMHQLQ